MKPYFDAGGITIYCGRLSDALPSIEERFDLIVADPPYGITALPWDAWPSGWLADVLPLLAPSGSMWVFGTLRMFMDRAEEFRAAGWHLAQDVAGKSVDIIWEKHNGSGLHADRFRRVHEQAAQFYPSASAWSDVHKTPQFTMDAKARRVTRNEKPAHFGEVSPGSYESYDGGPRLMRSVIEVRSMHGTARNETEKPIDLIAPLIEYACPAGGAILDPFCGSGPVLEIAKRTGRRAVGIDMRKDQCRVAASRVVQEVLSL